MDAWRGAEATLGQMQTRIPAGDQDLLAAQRAWAIHNMPEVVIDGHLGQSHGGRDGVIDSEIDEYVYSSPIDYNYRVYLHLNQAEGDPVQGTTFRHAAGVGLEYTSTDWLATGELLDIDNSGPHPQGSLYWTPDDHWKIGGAYAVRTLDLPIAALVVGDSANRLALDATYRVSESRSFGVEAVGENFTDSNQRREFDGFWTERWITGPVYKLDTRVDVDTSSNSLDNTNYFNPRRDLSGIVTFENMWQQYRHYDNALSHEFDFGIGEYWERNYGDGVVALARYQLVYEVNDRLTLKAGVGRSIRPFDGQRERLDQILFNLDGRF
jgi:biofilm PGA synthesis protein PgaA